MSSKYAGKCGNFVGMIEKNGIFYFKICVLNITKLFIIHFCHIKVLINKESFIN